MEAAQAGGRPLSLAPEYKDFLTHAGFVDVVGRRSKWPTNTWPKDPYYKKIGAWVPENLDGGAEGLSMALFARFLGWSREEVLMFCAEVRESIKDRRLHNYVPIYVVHDRKPGNTPGTGTEDAAAGNDTVP